MPAQASRPRRSRAGLVIFLLALAALAWEIVGRVSMPALVTPVKFARSAWAVAGGGSVSTAGAPSAEELAQNAYRPLPYVNYGLKPNWTRPPTKKRTGRTEESHTNSLGFRGPEIQQPKPAGRYRVICIGGSTTYDDCVNDDETYPLRLQEFLRAGRPGRDIEVINAGVPSYTTAENVANLAFRLLDLQPDALVLYEGINDWRPRTYPDFDNAYFHYRKVWDGSARLWETGEGEMAGGINPLIQYNSPPEGDPAANARAAGHMAFERNLVSMIGIARENGIAVVLVTNTLDEASPWLIQDPAALAGIREHNDVIRQVAAAHDVLLVDLDAQYPKGSDVPAGGLFALDDFVHNNARGSEVKARIIADGMLASLLK